MTPPYLNQKQMMAILTKNGYNTVCNTYWDAPGVERVVMSNGINEFTLRLKKFYSFPEVIKRCEMLGIWYNQIPEDIKEEFATCLDAYRKEKNNWFMHEPTTTIPNVNDEGLKKDEE